MLQPWRGLRFLVRTVILKNMKNYSDINFHGQRHVLTVSTTRGVPSTSVNLKEALCEKIPIHYDILRNIRQEHGSSVISQITVENIYQGLNGVNTMVRETSEIDPKYGIRYRGLTIPEVVTLLPREGKSPSAESVFWLLLTGDVPTQEQTASLIADWSARREKKKDWWSGPGGGIVGSVLQTLPKTTSPLGKLSVALTVFDSRNHMNEALKNGALSYTHWEYMYEDSMELLATLPAIVGLIAKGELKNLEEENGDWIQFLSECLCNAFDISKNHKKSLMDFLRLYIVLNADENGGIPGVHVTEILGASQSYVNQALAAGALAYTEEPKSGTISEYMEFQRKIQRLLGQESKEEKLRNYITTIIQRDKLTGYKEAEICDPKYTVLENYAREHLPNDTGVKLSQSITKILSTMMKSAKGKNIYPEQNAIAAPIFQFYGLKDMEFNQILLCMSRALGAVASIIWTRAVNASVEQPTSKCTYSYLNSIQGTRGKRKRGKHTKNIRK
ncbi:citrate synthase, mitochondrial isoform X1 [Bombus terrestris]|uniref:Citrate synthase, mitochondrial isoform X1 n=2 Tax=Bombus terrestris TaxID=30195 RepID=A0A9C6SAX7_BOMTE|nr:citrate synthase, mitochondrial isoform X1 [Bombus terrestris]XP_048262489.1 citrate synthase, mitochondrial isoform X1 [Bombus terrestris]